MKGCVKLPDEVVIQFLKDWLRKRNDFCLGLSVYTKQTLIYDLETAFINGYIDNVLKDSLESTIL